MTKRLCDRSGATESISMASDESYSNLSSTWVTPSRAVGYGRVIFIMVLVFVAAILGFLGFYFLSETETNSAESQFITINERALNSAVGISRRKLLGGDAMAAVISNALPDAAPWPFVFVPGFNEIVDHVVPTSLSKGLNFAPIVLPEQAEAWEEFAQNTYNDFFGEDVVERTGADHAPGESSFGFGIWAKDGKTNSSDGRFHDTTGETSWDSPNKILVPKLHHAFYNSPLLLFQVHFPKIHGQTIDGVIECSKIRAKSDDPKGINCGTISDFAFSNSPEMGPGGLVVVPIYPANDPTTLTGFIVGFLIWREVLEDVFADQVSGVDCVLSTPNQAYSYEIINGHPVFLGEGDHHDSRYNKFGRSAILASSEGGLNNYTQTYKLSIYPNERLYEAYSTNNPMVATIGAVLIILFTSILFFAYDHFVRKDMTAKKDLLDAKRQFVRFVSHEVRTPLNSVCMGLILLQEEIARSLGFRSTEAMLDADEETRLEAGKKNGQEGSESWFHLAYEVQSNAQSSVDVLDDLLNYDKIESGTLMLELTKVDVWELVAKTVVEFKLPAATKKITLDLQLPVVTGDIEQPSFLPPDVREQKVVGDCVRITQVLRNLVSNALKFTPEGGQLHVSAQWIERTAAGQKVKNRTTPFKLSNSELITALKSGMLEVKVTDTGAGMSKEQLAKLFQQGMQFNVNELQAGQGSGLGLYIAKGIVEQHGGKLTACSEGLGCGTTFTMTVPLYNIPEPEKTESQSELFSAQNSFRQSKLYVLIVDDATSNRKLLRRLLENRGHICDEAEDGHVGVEMVQQATDKDKPYDMILLDYEMPTMNGPTAALEIRKIGSDAFVIGITGNMMAEDVAYFKSKGANAVLPKPFKISSLEDLCVEYSVCGVSNWKV